VVEWWVQHKAKYILSLQVFGWLEEIQRVCQENQKVILWQENLRNSFEEQTTLRLNELD